MDRSTSDQACANSSDSVVRSIYLNQACEIDVETKDAVSLIVQLNTPFRASCIVGTLRHSDASTLGRGFFYASGERARIAVEGECRVLELSLSRSEVDRLLLENHDEPNGASSLRPLHGQTDFVLLGLLSRALVGGNIVSGLTSQNIVAALAGRYSTSKPAPRRRGLAPATLRRVEELVASDLSSVTLRSMAEEANLSLFHFAREFKEQTGQTPWTFVTERRAWFALQLLLSGKPIKQVAKLAGFTHASHMGRAFRQQFGMPPSVVRSRIFP